MLNSRTVNAFFLFALFITLIESEKLSAQETDILDSKAGLSTECGGLIDELAGAINYKVGEVIDGSGICVWMIRAGNKSNVQFEMIEDGLENSCSNCADIRFYELENPQFDSRLQYADTIEPGDRRIHNLTGGPVIYVVFSYLSYSEPITGFSLTFKGIGEDAVYWFGEKTFSLHTSATLAEGSPRKGSFKYPAEPQLYREHEFVSLLLQSETEYNEELFYVTFLAPFVNGLSEMDDFCQNEMMVYEVDRHGSELQTRLTYCKPDPYFNTTIFTHRSPIIVTFFVIYDYSPSTGFQLEWETKPRLSKV